MRPKTFTVVTPPAGRLIALCGWSIPITIPATSVLAWLSAEPNHCRRTAHLFRSVLDQPDGQRLGGGMD
jgi:hypothetical protein